MRRAPAASATLGSSFATWCRNVLAPFLIMLTAFVGQVILAEASLSYLGLGVQELTAARGLMLQGGAEEYASTAPWIGLSRSRHCAHSLQLQPVRRRAPRCPGSQAARSLIVWQSSQMTTPLMAKLKM
jgi:hypothetical protein